MERSRYKDSKGLDGTLCRALHGTPRSWSTWREGNRADGRGLGRVLGSTLFEVRLKAFALYPANEGKPLKDFKRPNTTTQLAFLRDHSDNSMENRLKGEKSRDREASQEAAEVSHLGNDSGLREQHAGWREDASDTVKK